MRFFYLYLIASHVHLHQEWGSCRALLSIVFSEFENHATDRSTSQGILLQLPTWTGQLQG